MRQGDRGKPSPDRADRAPIQLRLLAEVLKLLSADAIRVWLSGGWAVDFHVGEITREHDDIDFLIFNADADRVREILVGAGFVALAVRHPEEHLHLDKQGERVSLTFIEHNNQGRLVTPGRFSDWPYTPDVLDSPRRRLGDITSAVISIAALVDEKENFSHHPAGAPPRERDHADLARLRALVEAQGKP